MSDTPISREGARMGTVHVRITLSNVDTGTTHMIVTRQVALELGFDLEETSMYSLTVADSRRVRAPRIQPVEIRFEDRSYVTEAAVLGDECLMGVIPLEALDLVVDPRQQRVTPNPAHPEGPVYRA